MSPQESLRRAELDADLSDLRGLAPGPAPRSVGPLEFAEVVKKPKPEKGPPTGIKPKNKDRAAKAFAEDFGPCSRMARFGKCAVPECTRAYPTSKLQACHVVSRGAGGKDWANVIGMCGWHHAEQEGSGVVSFPARYGFDMAEAARAVAELVTNHFCDEFPEMFRGRQRCEICQRPMKGLARHSCRLVLVETEAANGVLVLESFYRCAVAGCLRRYTHDEAAALKRRA